LNPVSFPLLSVQLRFIWLVDMAVAVRLPGADGTGSVVVVVVNIVVVVVGDSVVVVTGSVEVVLVVEMIVVVGSVVVVVGKGVSSHTSPIPSPSLSR
jgi:hypothetical protein